MKPVSNNYKNTMNQTIRPASQFQARLEMLDYGVEADSTLTESLKEIFASSIFDKSHDCDYITFEKDLFEVGGSDLILPKSKCLRNGFVSSVLTDSDGLFAQIPTIDVSFTIQRTFVGMTYSFAKSYPTRIRVTAYLDGYQVQQFVSEPNGLEYVDEQNHIVDCDRIKFEFLAMTQPYRRLRLSRLVFGLVKIFNISDIISAEHNSMFDPISTSLPYDKLTMTVTNYNKEYNPDNPQGMWEYFKNGQPLRVRYGAYVGTEIEWVDAAYLFLSDAPSVNQSTVTFEAKDAISCLTGIYNKGLWRADGITLYDLAVDVLTDAGVTYYEIPSELQSIMTYVPMPVLTHRECLQLIANAGRCVLLNEVDGKIVMRLQLNAEVSLSDNGHLPWANVQNTYNGGVPYDYISFEPNKWIIASDSKRFIVPENTSTYKPTCFVSAALSGNDSIFSSYPTLYVAYSLPVSSYQFQIGFDAINENFAPDFNVIFSRDGELVRRIEVRENTEILYTVNEEVLRYNLVTIEIISTSKPNHRIRVESINNGRVTDFHLDYSVALQKPKVTKTEELKSVDVTVHTYGISQENSRIYSAEGIDISGEKEIQVNYSPSTDITAVVTGGTVLSSVFYAETGFITIQAVGAVDIAVNGKELIEKKTTVSVQVNNRGEVCPMDNPLISDMALARDVGAWIGNYLKNRNSYETNFRQDFRLDTNDVIYIKSEFEEMIPARITKLQYKLPGQEGAINVRGLT